MIYNLLIGFYSISALIVYLMPNPLHIRGTFSKFPDFFFVQAYKIVVDSLQYVIAIHLMR